MVLPDRFFFITCRVYRPCGRLTESEFSILAKVVRERHKKHGFILSAWVFLIDQWHAIIFPRSHLTISTAMESIKVSATRRHFSQEEIMGISEPKSDGPVTRRKGHEPPMATSVCGWRYHHVGIPTEVRRPNEIYLERFKMYVSGFESSPCGIEWMRFEPDSPVHALVKSVPHIAFEVDDLQSAMAGKQILTEPNSPSEGIMVAMILDNGAPVELLEFRRYEDELRH